ncbi:hypothetical protein HPB49_004627 [Dermacentor silvarum]|uniref:Uncharacterized protein n=1 Tax=Dermacentor silvarum TaxID=543639 RepID=A0ACB8DB49_DERSI|nr:hypothetical protein HPB49_004627 [Dermacentor silvarum]
MDHKIGSARTWHLLRHLLDADKSKLEARQQLQKLVYKYEGTTDELIAEVRDRYLSCAGSGSLPEYSGSENPDLDSPITVGCWVWGVVVYPSSTSNCGSCLRSRCYQLLG